MMLLYTLLVLLLLMLLMLPVTLMWHLLLLARVILLLQMVLLVVPLVLLTMQLMFSRLHALYLARWCRIVLTLYQSHQQLLNLIRCDITVGSRKGQNSCVIPLLNLLY